VSSEALALFILFLIHAIGLGVLFLALLRSSDDGGWRDWWPRDDDGGDEPPPANPSPAAPPLDGAKQSPVRLREPGRLADAHPRAPRRPEHAPERVPQRERV
jgi:hypothetical protein